MRAIVLAAVLALPGCVAAHMADLDDLPAGSETLSISGIPAWQSGRFRVGAAGRGWVARRARTDRRELAADSLRDRAGVAGVIDRGTLRFGAHGAEIGGKVDGECRYAQASVERCAGPLAIEEGVAPLRLLCRLTFNGADAGTLAIEAATIPAERVGAGRIGEVRFGGAALVMRSSHRIAGSAVRSDRPLGYLFDGPSGTVGAVDTSGTAARLFLPADPVSRRAVIAGGLVAALLWEPGSP